MGDNDLEWFNAGLFATGSLVFENGAPVETFNADTKVSVGTTPGTVYGITASGVHGSIPFSATSNPGNIAQRNAQGGITVPLNPSSDYDACSKQYVNRFIPKPTDGSVLSRVPYADSSNNIGYLPVSDGTVASGLVLRKPDSSITTVVPTNPSDLTAVNVAYLASQLATMKTVITSSYVAAGQTNSNAIGVNNYGMYVIKGADGQKISIAGQTIQTNFMMIWKYAVGTSRRVMYIYQTSIGLGSGEGENNSNIGIQAGSSAGSRVVLIPLQTV